MIVNFQSGNSIWKTGIPNLTIQTLTYRTIQYLSHKSRGVWSIQLLRGMIMDFISGINGEFRGGCDLTVVLEERSILNRVPLLSSLSGNRIGNFGKPNLKFHELNYRTIVCLSHQARCVWSIERPRGIIYGELIRWETILWLDMELNSQKGSRYQKIAQVLWRLSNFLHGNSKSHFADIELPKPIVFMQTLPCCMEQKQVVASTKKYDQGLHIQYHWRSIACLSFDRADLLGNDPLGSFMTDVV